MPVKSLEPSHWNFLIQLIFLHIDLVSRNCDKLFVLVTFLMISLDFLHR